MKKASTRAGKELCPVSDRCGGCDLLGMDYERQLAQKNQRLKKLLSGLTMQLHPIVGMENPAHYRCKVNAAFGLDWKGKPVVGR